MKLLRFDICILIALVAGCVTGSPLPTPAPLSMLPACAEDLREVVQFRRNVHKYQSCYDMAGTNDKAEVLVCLSEFIEAERHCFPPEKQTDLQTTIDYETLFYTEEIKKTPQLRALLLKNRRCIAALPDNKQSDCFYDNPNNETLAQLPQLGDEDGDVVTMLLNKNWSSADFCRRVHEYQLCKNNQWAPCSTEIVDLTNEVFYASFRETPCWDDHNGIVSEN